MRKNKYGVFYTCFTEVKAVEYSLHELFKVYPDMPVYLVSDGGSDYSHLVDMFPDKKIETLLEHDSRGKLNQIYDHNYLEDENMKASVDSVVTFVDRVKRAIEYCDSEYLFIMEPDVLLRGEISIIEDAKLMGMKINDGLHAELGEFLETFEKGIPVSKWGCAAPILHSDTFLEAKEVLESDDSIIETLCRLDRRTAFYDALLPIMFGLVGEEEVYNPEVVECLRNPSWRTSGHPIVHQFRAKYETTENGYISTNGNRDHMLKEFTNG